MALQKVLCSVRVQMHRMLSISALRYSNEAEINASKFEPKSQEEYEQPSGDTEYKFRGAEVINDVYLTGTVFGEVLPTTTGNGVIFFLDMLHNGRYGPYKVRTKVVAFGNALPADGSEALKEGQKIFLRGRIGSKVERSPDGTSVVRSNHVVGRFITLI